MKNDRLTDRLDRFKNLVAKPSSQPPAVVVSSRYRRLAEAVAGEIITDPAGCYIRSTTLFPFGYEFGYQRLPVVESGATVAAASYSALECHGEVPLTNLLFIDTETTGLGGAGAVPFLVGCGVVTDRGFEVRQYLLPDYADEAAMLERLLSELAADKTLVSYNGAAFDLNLIRDRFIVNRVAREIPHAGHFDLLHSTRRLFRRRLSDCSLTSIEREVFGFHRQNDIPGHLIPAVYFDWLQTDATDSLVAVLEHNRLDILSLYFLLLRVDEIFRSEGRALDYAEDLYSLSRVYGRRKRHQKVIANYETLAKTSGGSLSDEVLFYHSLAFKRQGEWDRAAELWRQLAERTGSEAALAALELSKHCEHRLKDYHGALEYALRAGQAETPGRQKREDFERRVGRLRRKLDDNPQ
jgi:uncharacterized protein YprB with RNaseH-like and TPR domain